MMVNDLDALLTFMFSCWDKFIVLYFSGGILSAVFAVWIIRKLSRLLDRLG